MRASALLLGSLWVSSLVACGGSSFEPGAAPGSSGSGGASAGSGGASAGSGGTTSAGSGGTTSAGSGGTTSAGSGGTTSAGSGGTTSAGSGGTTSAGSGGTTSAGSGGTTTAGSGGTTSAGSGGTTSAGSGGTTSAGTGGTTSAGSGGGATCAAGATECVGSSDVRTCESGAWSPPTPCPIPPDACVIAVCEQGKCSLAGTAPPADPPHNCQKMVCSGGQFVAKPDPNDTPGALGECDAPSCDGVTPKHAPSDAKCSAVKRCDAGAGSKCVCRVCPAGTVAGLSGTGCGIDGATTTALASSAAVSHGAEQAIDRSASTYWLAAASEATLTLDVPALPMSAVVVHPWMPALNANAGFTWTIKVLDVDGKSTTYEQQVKYSADEPAPLTIPLTAPVAVEKVTITGATGSAWVPGLVWGVFEVTYLLCD